MFIAFAPIVFARCSKRCARTIVIRKDNLLSGKVIIKRKCHCMVRKKWQKKLQMQQKWQRCFDVSLKFWRLRFHMKWLGRKGVGGSRGNSTHAGFKPAIPN